MIDMGEPLRQQQDWDPPRLIVDAEEFFARMLEAIAQARRSIDFEYYIFELDFLGVRFREALSAAARRGVRVRVMIDGLGSASSCTTLSHQLFLTGVDVRVYHPLPWLTGAYRWSRGGGVWLYKFLRFLLNINRRNHRKLCVVDEQVAWLGSFNISADHLPLGAGGKGWRDYAVELHGPDVHALASGFSSIWTATVAHFHRGFIARHLSN